MRPATKRWRALLGFVLLLAACDDTTTPEQPAPAQVIVLATVDPDLSNPLAPVPGRLVWISTRSGTARFLLDSRELTDNRVPVSAGELVSTDIDPWSLEPNNNNVEIYFVLEQQGGSTISVFAPLFLDATCTRHDHCDGACVDFECE